jgi:hypothetical protein
VDKALEDSSVVQLRKPLEKLFSKTFVLQRSGHLANAALERHSM